MKEWRSLGRVFQPGDLPKSPDSHLRLKQGDFDLILPPFSGRSFTVSAAGRSPELGGSSAQQIGKI